MEGARVPAEVGGSPRARSSVKALPHLARHQRQDPVHDGQVIPVLLLLNLAKCDLLTKQAVGTQHPPGGKKSASVFFV